MSKKIPKVSIIILHFENVHLLTECLKSCQKINYSNYEIIVVKNGDRSNLTFPVVKDRADQVSNIIYLQGNVGYARANNHGIQDALSTGADYILLLNDDTTVSPHFLNILVESAERLPDVGMLGPAIYYFDEPDRIWFSGARFDRQTCTLSTVRFDQFQHQQSSGPVDSDYVSGCALMVKSEVLHKIGLFNEKFFLYWEDVDLGVRSINAGYKNVIVPNAHIWHKISISAGGPDSPLKVYHKTRSHLLMAKLHAPWVLSSLQATFFRDIAWLLLKSSDEDRMRKARAYFAAIKDYHLHKISEGPAWLWKN